MNIVSKKLLTIFFIGLLSLFFIGCANTTSMSEMDDEDFPMEKKAIDLKSMTK